MDRYDFQPFDSAENQNEVASIIVPNSVFYTGELRTRDNFTVPVYAIVQRRAAIDRVLIQINGGTGTDARFFLNNFKHKAVVMLSMRGLSRTHLGSECPLGSNLINCLRGVSFLQKVNPQDNGRDVVDLMRVILGEAGALLVNGESRGHEFFQVSDKTFNVETGSFGATILAYALNEDELPALGRVFIDGPSSPGEYVISDGFRNSREVVNNFFDALNFSPGQRASFINVMKSRHTAPNTDCVQQARIGATTEKDCLSTSMIWAYMLDSYDTISMDRSVLGLTEQETRMRLDALRDTLLLIPASEARTSDDVFAAVSEAYNSAALLTISPTWEQSRFDLLSSNSPLNNTAVPGFTSRIGQICSAYISRADGDSQSRFDMAKADGANDPFWYGFLINYRDLLTICPQIRAQLRAGIVVPPSSLEVRAEALVQYQAGLDEKHHQSDVDEMESYFDDSVIVRDLAQQDALQGGLAPFREACIDDLRNASFETPLATLGEELDKLIASCSQNSQ